MKSTDTKQYIFENFEVPDPIRIKKAIKLIKKYLGDVRGLNILECGVVKGGVADLLNKEGANCFGVDINPRQIEGVKVIQADLNEGFLDFNIEFDVIFAGEVIEHLFDDVKFIKNCRELLKSNGLLIITTPNLVFSANRILMLFGKMPKYFVHAPYHYHIYNKRTIENLIRQEGFEILKTISSHILFSTRRNKFGRIFEILGDFFPSIGAHLIVCARKIEK